MGIMTDQWLARLRADPAGRARQVRQAHQAFLAGGSPPDGSRSPSVRDVVAQSWLRSAQARVDPDDDPPVSMPDDELSSYRAEHPLSRVIGTLRDLVGACADDGEHLMAVTDAGGLLLWVEGHSAQRKRAEVMNFVEGAIWDERHAGTNAPGTSLALGEPVQIFSTEHYRHTVQDWTCAAAPIRDPDTGLAVGVIDVTGSDLAGHPHSLALVKAAARAAEAELGWHRDPASGIWLPRPRSASATDGQPHDRLAILGRPDGLLWQSGAASKLNRRHAEVLFLLSAHRAGLTSEQLACALYGEYGDPAAVRVEFTRLRRAVGDLVESRPYRLTRSLASDYADVAAALRQDDVEAALAAYAGPLLPASDAPGVVTQRDWLDVQMRSAVLAHGSLRVLSAWAERFGFDDLEIWERLAARLPAGSARRAAAAARSRQLSTEYGLAVAPVLASGVQGQIRPRRRERGPAAAIQRARGEYPRTGRVASM
jgi:hypothetical protein